MQGCRPHKCFDNGDLSPTHSRFIGAASKKKGSAANRYGRGNTWSNSLFCRRLRKMCIDPPREIWHLPKRLICLEWLQGHRGIICRVIERTCGGTGYYGSSHRKNPDGIESFCPGRKFIPYAAREGNLSTGVLCGNLSLSSRYLLKPKNQL